MKSAATLIALCMLSSLSAAGISPRLESFLQKIQVYYERQKGDWSMPQHKPSGNDDMPSPDIIGMMMVDEETGLAFSPSTGNLYDPELKIGLHAASRTIFDFRTGKKYSLEELRKGSKNRNELL